MDVAAAGAAAGVVDDHLPRTRSWTQLTAASRVLRGPGKACCQPPPANGVPTAVASSAKWRKLAADDECERAHSQGLWQSSPPGGGVDCASFGSSTPTLGHAVGHDQKDTDNLDTSRASCLTFFDAQVCCQLAGRLSCQAPRLKRTAAGSVQGSSLHRHHRSGCSAQVRQAYTCEPAAPLVSGRAVDAQTAPAAASKA